LNISAKCHPNRSL